jgi:CheY-like chemotaxis protein
MDINLPGMNGFEATEELRRREDTRSIPVIGLSAAAFDADAQRADRVGIDRYLNKPVKLVELARALEELLR